MKGINSEQWLAEELSKVRHAGNKLARRAAYVVDNFDGVHRLALALSEWYTAIANEGGRDKLRRQLKERGFGISEITLEFDSWTTTVKWDAEFLGGHYIVTIEDNAESCFKKYTLRDLPDNPIEFLRDETDRAIQELYLKPKETTAEETKPKEQKHPIPLRTGIFELPYLGKTYSVHTVKMSAVDDKIKIHYAVIFRGEDFAKGSFEYSIVDERARHNFNEEIIAAIRIKQTVGTT